MTDLSRSLLAAAREGLAPDAAVAARVRAKVAAAVAAGATGATGATTALTAPAAKAATTSSVLLKLGAVLLALGVVTSIVVVVVRNRERTPEAPHLAVPAAEPDELRADIRVAACNDVDDPRVLSPAPARNGQAPVAVADAERTRPAAPTRTERTAESAAPAAEPASLSREVELIDLAMVSLRKNAPLAAIEAIRVFDRETLGQGQMAEEAAAIAIEAHCTLGDDVTDALAEFDRKWPSSAQRERLQTACFAKH
jgi:hypothetical protein